MKKLITAFSGVIFSLIASALAIGAIVYFFYAGAQVINLFSEPFTWKNCLHTSGAVASFLGLATLAVLPWVEDDKENEGE